MRKFLKILIPESIIDIYRNVKRRKKENFRRSLALKGETVQESDILSALINAGIKRGDDVMVHSSLSSIGSVAGGSESVINALLKAVGENGTILMPSFPAIGFNYDYLNTSPVFDVRNTPSKMGKITEDFRKMNGVKRSLHPTDPVCSFGMRAENYIKDHFGQVTPYNFASPFYKLVQQKGKILLIGVNLDSVTNFHTPEDAITDFKIPVYHSKLFEAKVVDSAGNERVMKTKVHNPDYSKKRKCNEMLIPFTKAGFVKQFKIGRADCMLIEADRMHDWLVESYYKGITIYTPKG